MTDVTVIIFILVMMVGLPATVFYFVRKSEENDRRCPWDLCGYLLPETPLISEMQTDSRYEKYSPEDCPGCGRTVCWDSYREQYVRIKM